MVGDATDVARLRTLLFRAEAALGEAGATITRALAAVDALQPADSDVTWSNLARDDDLRTRGGH